MIILACINLTRKKTLAEKITICDNIFTQAVGVMFKFAMDSAYVFPVKPERKVALHMLFVFFPIDVLYLDSNNKVVEIKEKFLPFTLYFPKIKATTIVELPNGTIKKTKTKKGDKIKLNL